MGGKIDSGLLGAQAWAAWEDVCLLYSVFRMGAAVAYPIGEDFPKANMEDAAPTFRICIARVAASAAVASGGMRVVDLLVVRYTENAGSPGDLYCQFLAGFKAFATTIRGLDEVTGKHLIFQLFPHPFFMVREFPA